MEEERALIAAAVVAAATSRLALVVELGMVGRGETGGGGREGRGERQAVCVCVVGKRGVSVCVESIDWSVGAALAGPRVHARRRLRFAGVAGRSAGE